MWATLNAISVRRSTLLEFESIFPRRTMPEIQTRMIGTPEALDALLLHLEHSGLIVHRRSRRKDGKTKMRQYLLIEVEPDHGKLPNLEPEDL
jgi:hypothetical protein